MSVNQEAKDDPARPNLQVVPTADPPWDQLGMNRSGHRVSLCPGNNSLELYFIEGSEEANHVGVSITEGRSPVTAG